MITHRLLPDGGFVAADTETRRTSYAYPTSTYATIARKIPERAAAEMVASANRETTPDHIRDSYDARNWALLGRED